MASPRVLAALLAVVALPAFSADRKGAPAAPAVAPLKAPAHGPIRVAFVLSENAELMDSFGPWEVFEYTRAAGKGLDAPAPFELYTVAETRDPVRTSGGVRLLPDHTFDDAPAPNVVVIPAQRGDSPKLLDWLRKSAATADVTMSVCVGSFTLARTGLLDGLSATTHHEFYDGFQAKFPKVKVQRGVRYVDNGRIATAAGLTSGIDLALHVVERYLGGDVAAATAVMLEHEGKGWRPPAGGERRHAVAAPPPGAAAGDLVCGMTVDPAKALRAEHGGKTYHFCSEDCRKRFLAEPERYVAR
jgi:transcriptional regulator GlxA family with amidase domain/YHS domain-containing protein